MSETKNPGEKKLSVSGKTLTLKPRTETGVVRQSFSHGRSKQVVVEKVKRRAWSDRAKPRRKPAPAVEAKKARRQGSCSAGCRPCRGASRRQRPSRSLPASCCAL